MNNYDDVLERYPEALELAIERSHENRQEMSDNVDGLEFIVKDLERWPTGDVVTVAFLDGSDDLHAAIACTAQAISDNCSLSLDFGLDEDTGSYRRWDLSDTEYSADIRVSFDESGNWSLVGMASIDFDLTSSELGVGGAPHQRSLNLGGFDRRLPGSWRRTVLHEFLHALAFSHEHQNPLSECQSDFRWEDDEGYEQTTDGTGRFVVDARGRRPGIYTYLSGPPNEWDRARVDRNLRSETDGSTIQSAFDPESVMLYRFAPLFYHSSPSACAPTSEGDQLSVGDIRGLRLLYPEVAGADDKRLAAAVAAREVLEELESLEASWPAPGLGISRRLQRICSVRSTTVGS